MRNGNVLIIKDGLKNKLFFNFVFIIHTNTFISHKKINFDMNAVYD